MTVRALFSECNLPLWLDVAADLAQEQDWRPVYWVGAQSLAGRLAQAFPQAVFHDHLRAIRGLPAAGGPAPAPLDQEILADMAPCEAMVLRILDRMDPVDCFGLRERLDLYYRYLGYWSAVLEKYQPQVAFFSIAPHMAYDYVLYALCQRRGIPTMMLEQALINSRLYVTSRYDTPDSLVQREYRRLLAADEGGPIDLPADMVENLEALTRDYQAPFYVARIERRGGPLDWARLWLEGKSLPRRVLNLGRRLHQLLTTPAPANYMKVRGRRFSERPISHLGFEYYRWLGRRARVRLKAQYQALAGPEPLDRPYVYLPLHYQPEMSTMPTGGYYDDQRLLAGLICSCLPPGWLLYVKEHPVQVADIGRGQISRPPGYYQDLLALPQVRLVPLTQSSFELMDHAQATATITGQAAWEAVNRGKPALTFGHCWYKGCEGISFIRGRGELCQALERVAAGQVTVDRRKVRLFALAVARVARQGYVEPIFGRAYNLDQRENSRGISHMLGDYWQREARGAGLGGGGESA